MNTIHGVKTVDHNLVRAGAMMGASGRQLLTGIVFPAALPSIFSGLRIAIGSAWMLTVTAEMVAVKSGLGYVLWDSYYFLRYDLVLAADDIDRSCSDTCRTSVSRRSWRACYTGRVRPTVQGRAG
jgi:NitT/TauT family transport system permease protein